MSSEYEEIARRAYDALDGDDLDRFLAAIDPDAESDSLIAESEGRSYRGHEGAPRPRPARRSA